MATATTATASASQGSPYVGRFAPSPTGDLHLGSLVAAAGSYLHAHRHGGRWLVRIDDLDRARVLTGAESRILATLEACGFEWDGPLLRQSDRSDAYRAALERLRIGGLTYECTCSRRQLEENGAAGAPYPGTCRELPAGRGGSATRFRLPREGAGRFDDELQGVQCRPWSELGDCIVRRRDGLAAYQLACVVDDAAQGITHVVRGADLLDSTWWQIALHEALGTPPPVHAHLPLVIEPDGAKLAKSRRSVPIERGSAGASLVAALALLGVLVPAQLRPAPPAEIWDWALRHANLDGVKGVRNVRAGDVLS